MIRGKIRGTTKIPKNANFMFKYLYLGLNNLILQFKDVSYELIKSLLLIYSLSFLINY